MLQEGYINNLFDFGSEENFYSDEMESEIESFDNAAENLNANHFSELNYNFGDFLRTSQVKPAKTVNKDEAKSQEGTMDKSYNSQHNMSPRSETYSNNSSSKKCIQVVFKTEKIQKEKPMKEFLNKKRKNSEDDKEDKLYRNRISAKKSRQKKKAYINTLEAKYAVLEAELRQAKKQLNENKNTTNSKISEIENKEKEYFQLLNKNKSSNKLEENKIKLVHSKMQSSLVVELFRDLIKSLVPLDIKYFETKAKMLNIYKFETIDEFLDLVMQNQYNLNESYNFQYASGATSSYPFQVYMFYEHLKKMALDFKENVFQVRK
jgi:hypothetical protein